jgi:hypothetical protein
MTKSIEIAEIKERAIAAGWDGKYESKRSAFFEQMPPKEVMKRLPWGYGLKGGVSWGEVLMLVAMKRWLDDKDEEAGRMLTNLKAMEDTITEKRANRRLAVRAQEWKEGHEVRQLAAKAAAASKSTKYIDVFAEGFFDKDGKEVEYAREYVKPTG